MRILNGPLQQKLAQQIVAAKRLANAQKCCSYSTHHITSAHKRPIIKWTTVWFVHPKSFIPPQTLTRFHQHALVEQWITHLAYSSSLYIVRLCLHHTFDSRLMDPSIRHSCRLRHSLYQVIWARLTIIKIVQSRAILRDTCNGRPVFRLSDTVKCIWAKWSHRMCHPIRCSYVEPAVMPQKMWQRGSILDMADVRSNDARCFRWEGCMGGLTWTRHHQLHS